MPFYQTVSYTEPKISVVLTVACSVACSSSINKGRHTAIYIVLPFLLLVHIVLKDLDFDLDSTRTHVVSSDLELDLMLVELELAVAGLDTSLLIWPKSLNTSTSGMET